MTSKELHLLLVENDAVDILNVQRSFPKNESIEPNAYSLRWFRSSSLTPGYGNRPSDWPSQHLFSLTSICPL